MTTAQQTQQLLNALHAMREAGAQVAAIIDDMPGIDADPMNSGQPLELYPFGNVSFADFWHKSGPVAEWINAIESAYIHTPADLAQQLKETKEALKTACHTASDLAEKRGKINAQLLEALKAVTEQLEEVVETADDGDAEDSAALEIAKAAIAAAEGSTDMTTRTSAADMIEAASQDRQMVAAVIKQREREQGEAKSKCKIHR